jgi:hypothetical protein
LTVTVEAPFLCKLGLHKWGLAGGMSTGPPEYRRYRTHRCVRRYCRASRKERTQ